MNNIPKIKTGIIAVSRDCFSIDLSTNRKNNLVNECKKLDMDIFGSDTIIENENDIQKALDELYENEINALVIYLGNFGPEGPVSILAEHFDGPVMLCAAAEEPDNDLIQDRGDAYCGLLNSAYNCGLRNLKVYFPEYPVGTASELAVKIQEYIPVVRILSGLSKLKIFAFGPRPFDFLACNAPIKPLYNIGVEIMENSELDLFDIYKKANGAKEIASIAKDMAKELGHGNRYPGLLTKLAQYEYALLKFFEENLGASEYGVFANKCWPAYESWFGFVPCYVNSRLANRGIPVACETDIYGALSEYILTAATEYTATLLDINNTVPARITKSSSKKMKGYSTTDLFMGFHCGNTASSCLVNPEIKYQLIMHRLLEPDKEPDITRGTLEGRIKPGEATIFRLQSTAEGELKSYMAQGEILDINPQSYGGTGIIAIKEMARFYRHILISKNFPHHTALAFSHTAKPLYEAMKMLGIEDNSHNQPKEMPYPGENPF